MDVHERYSSPFVAGLRPYLNPRHSPVQLRPGQFVMRVMLILAAGP